MRRRERGVALVVVMWVAILLTVIASSFIYEARTDALVVRNTISMARAEGIADAAVYRAVFELYRADNAPDAWRRDGSVRDWAYEGVPVKVEIRDESGKIDVNTAADPLLRGLFQSVGMSTEDANNLLDAVLDWRDPDNLKRINGAEEPEYRAAGLTYRPANAPFQAIEELQLVLGMRPEIYKKLVPFITTYSRQPGINPTLAAREVLLAIPGVTPQIVDAYIARRDQARAAGEPAPPFPEAGGFTANITPTASIRAEARLDDGTVFVREAVALLRPTPRRPVTFVAWRESTSPTLVEDQSEAMMEARAATREREKER